MAVPAEDTSSVLTLEFKDFRTFLNTFSGGISRTGMFVETSETEPVGSEVEFAFALVGGDSLLKGRGEVVWVSDGDSEAPGMGLRFSEIDADGERLIERIEEIRTKSGRPIFDVESGSRPDAAAVSPGGPTTDLLRAELETLRQQHLEERARLVADLDTVRADRERLEKRLHALEAADVSGERDQLLSEREALRLELESTRGEVGLLEHRVTEQEGDLARFAEQGRYAMAERDRLESQKKSLAEELEAARAEIVRLESQRESVTETETRLAEAERTVTELRSSEESLKDELSKARSRLERIEEKTRGREAELETELAATQASREELRLGLERGQAELDAARLQFEESAGRTLELEHEAASLEGQLTEARQQVETLESERTVAQDELEILKVRHTELQAELGERSMAVASLRDVHDRLEAGLGEARAALAELQVREAREGLETTLPAPTEHADIEPVVPLDVADPETGGHEAVQLGVGDAETVAVDDESRPEAEVASARESDDTELPEATEEPEAVVQAEEDDPAGDTVEIEDPAAAMIIDEELEDAPEPRSTGLWAAIASKFKSDEPDADAEVEAQSEEDDANPDPEPEEYLIPDPGDGAETLSADLDDR